MNELANFCDGVCNEKIDQFIDNVRRVYGQDRGVIFQDTSYVSMMPNFPFIPGSTQLNHKTIRNSFDYYK